MVCERCEAQGWSNGTLRRPEACCRTRTCTRCGAAILTLAGIVVGVGDDTLAALARFGLASTEQLLLEPRQEGA